MNYDELQLEYIGGDSMDKIAIVKKEVQLQNWSEREFARQNSGLTIAEWCRKENINPSTYYYRLRKIRESLCEQIPVPVTEIAGNTQASDRDIRIVCGELQIEVSSDIPSEKLVAIIGALKC